MFAHPKIVFLHTPKTAGLSTLAALKQTFGPGLMTPQGTEHPSHLLIPIAARDAPRFTVVRNPWQWHASLYQFCKERGASISPLLARLSHDFRDSFELTLPRLLNLSRSDLSFCVQMMSAQRHGSRAELSALGTMIKSFDSLGFYGALHTGIAGSNCDALCLSRLSTDLPAWSHARTGIACSIPGRVNTSASAELIWTSAMIDMVHEREPFMTQTFGYAFGNASASRGVWSAPPVAAL